jgi:hypothetical protein
LAEHRLITGANDLESHMSNLRINVSRWTADSDEPDIQTYDQLADSMWQVLSEPTTPPCTLEDIMFVDPDGALRVDTVSTMPSPATLAAALPRSSEYLGWAEEIETGDEELDQYLGSGIRQVVINTRWWSAFPLRSGHPDAIRWLECDEEELSNDHAEPTGETLAWASGIENDSMTSGTFSWSLLDVGEGYVCFVADPDDDSNTYAVEERAGRTNRELSAAFLNWVDWDPVTCAVARAIELGGKFEGLASDLDDELSDSCEVRAYVDLSTT